MNQVAFRSKVQVWIHSRSDAPSASGAGTAAAAPTRKVLLLCTTPERGEFWQPVTGSVDNGESLETAALREAQEESGLSFLGPPLRLGHEFSYSDWRGQVHETVFELEAPPGAPTQAKIHLDTREHMAFRWEAPEEALALLKFDSNREALKLLLKRWKGSR